MYFEGVTFLLALLFALAIVTPVVLVYLLAVKGVDRFEPEPLWLLGLCFLWGVFGATFFAIMGNSIGLGVIQIVLDTGSSDPFVEMSTASFVAPLVEESTKGVALLAVWFLSAWWLKELDGALDGAIYGGMIGLGFTLTEDVLYVTSFTLQQGGAAGGVLFIIRTIFGGLGHASFTAMTGLGVGIAAESRSSIVKAIAPVCGWCAAVFLHFLHNFLVTFLNAGGVGLLLKLVVFWTFDLLFFVVLFVLVLRDRAIVVRGLIDEVGRLLHPLEYQRTIAHAMVVPLWNLFSLLGSPGGYRQARRKQLDLVKIAFVKQREARGENVQGWLQELRNRVQGYNQRGVFLGPRN